MTTAALDGITLIDLAGMGPSARCVRVLADLGARWLRLQPPAAANRVAGDWHLYGALRGAEVLGFDLKHPDARHLYLRLAEKADIVVEGFRPGVADRLGIGYGDLSAINPRLIYCACSGYGHSGPLAQQVGHDINYQALAGGLALIGRDGEGVPAIPAMTLADSAGGGWQAALRVLAALVARNTSGQGCFLDVSAAEGVIQLLAVDFDQHLAGEGVANSVLHGGYACYGVYGTADGKSLAVGAIEGKFFANLCAVLGIAEAAADQYRVEAQPALRRRLADIFQSRTRDAWVAAFAGVEACVTPVLDMGEVVDHPHWRARGSFAHYQHPRVGPARQVAAFGGGERGCPPSPQSSSYRTVLAELGCDPAEIEELAAAGVVS
jgi:alpha-methylacyl-CoA racemase